MKHCDIIDRANMGSGPNQMFLGHCYLIGKDSDGAVIPVDYDKARYWLGLAHDKGVRTASFLLGTIYESGLGVEVDIERAMELFLAATDAKNVFAMAHLGRIYSNGAFLNPSKALYWYQQIMAVSIELDDSVSDVIQEAQQYIKANG